jgi:TonB C terminal
MRREANIPLFLWIATAVLVHLLWGGGADRGARVIEDQLDIQRFAREVQRRARGSVAPIEIALIDEAPSEPPSADQKPDPEPEKQPEVAPPKPPEETRDDPEAKKPNPVKEAEKKLEKKPEEPKKAEPEKKVDPKPVAPLPQELTLPKKVAVRQVVKDEHQEDNPNAAFIANQANHVAEESQARITSADQNDAVPTPGGDHSGPVNDPGDSNRTEIRQSEDRPGEADHAPSETPDSTPEKLARLKMPSASAAARDREAASAHAQHGAQAGAQQSSATRPGQEGRKEEVASKATEPVPEALANPAGVFTVPGPRQAFVDQAASRAQKHRPLPQRRVGGVDVLGYGSAGTTKSGVNLNLMPASAVAAIGSDELARERLIDGERRKSAHRGSWHPTDMNRWRSAIENYVPSVRLGNQTALNTQRSAFANYLNAIHNRIHPIFALNFLDSLDSLPASHPMNNQNLATSLEIVLDQDAGKIVRMGVTKTSGLTMFDVAALESVQKASPFGAPPREIVSPDGNVYLHWEFHRDPMACSTYNAHPFILKVQPKTAPPEISPPAGPTLDPREVPPAERHGRVPRHRSSALARN